MPYDYTAVTAESVTEATEQAIARAEELVAGVVAAPAPRSWADSAAPLDVMAAVLVEGYGRGAFMARVHADSEVRASGVAAEERTSKWAVDLVFRDDLYRAVKAYAETDEAAALAGERRRLLDFWMRDFRRAGHELDAEERKQVQALRTRLVELQVQFQKNLDEYEDYLELTKDDLDGLPDSYVEGLREGSEPGTFRVTLDYPDLIPFMQHARRRDLRRRLEHKNLNKGMPDNRPLIEEAVRTRREMAGLLGYPTWAHYAIEEKMAKNPDAVDQFYKDLVPGLSAKGTEELPVLRELLVSEYDTDDLRTWDFAYLDTALRKRDYGVDPLAVAVYFPLEQVVDGMFELTGEVFGLSYRRRDAGTAWHPDVQFYDIVDQQSGERIASFYADLFPREGKYGHAAAFPLVPGRAGDDGYVKPVAAIVANFPKPTKDKPSLLQHDDVVTLFHEFGHILHMCLTEVQLTRFSGAETEWDFVEAPSQIMEHWTWRADVLQRFARHHETGEPIPADLVARLVAARNLDVGLKNLRQVYYGKIDLAIHAGTNVDLDRANREAHAVTLFPFPDDTFMLAGFGHLMGGYDAGYYGYLWAKVFGDDMFSVFEAEGATSRDVGMRYRREVLARGGSRDGGELLRAFLGREPSSEAFLRYLGLDSPPAPGGEVPRR